MGGLFNRLLKRYDDRTFVIQLKARFIAYWYLIQIIVILIASIYTGYANLHNPLYGYAINIKIMSAYTGGFALSVLGLIILVRGYYIIAANLMLIIGFALLWVIIFFERTHVVSRLDTIVFVIVILSIMPIVTIKKKTHIIFVYAVINIFILFGFMFIFRDELNLPYSSFISYLSDNTLAMLVVALVSYQVYTINRRALDKAEHDILMRKRAEAAKAEQHLLTKDINVLAIELASLLEEVDIRDFVVDRLMRTPGAKVSWFSEYDPEQRLLKLQRIKAEPGLLDKAIKLLGSRIEGYKTSVSEDIYQEIVNSTVGKIRTLNDLTFGTIPQAVGSTIQSITGVDRFIGLSHVIEGKLFGLSMLGMGAHEPDPPTELLNTIAHLVAISLRRRTAEEALRESEQRYRTILESIADGYYEVDLAGNLTFFNDSVCELLGYSRDELTGMNNRQYTDEHGAAELLRIFNEVYETGRQIEGFGWEGIRKDQTRRFVETSVTLMKDGEGKPRGFRGIVRDITERKRAEEEREKLQAQLAQAQKMESIGILAGGIAHNFNNILMGIQGRASLMMMDKAPSRSDQRHLQSITDYVKSAIWLTNELIGFARGGKYEVKPTDLNELLKNENRLFGQTKKEIRIHENYEKALWTAEVDQGQMRQVFLNLYVNAWQAMPGGGDLYVQTENVILDQEYVKPFGINPGRYVRISVTDTGIGMDDATLEKVFDPFFTTKEKGQGSGLGLASVYGIIKDHGGFINAYSEEGIGSTFNIYLPASEKESEEQGPITDDRQGIQYGRGTVLLVDDEDIIFDVGQEMLERLGYQVLIARSGEEALDVYGKQKEEIDLVILDMIMPGMGGGEVFDRLKEMDRNVKVLLSSGYTINGQAKEIMDRGCGGFIQKPFAMEELSRKVKMVLDQ